MVVKIKTGKRLRGALSYNEAKCGKGDAYLLLASNFGCDVNELNFSEKLNRFQHLTDLNPKVETNTLHISLSFPKEESIDAERMKMIAIDYMERIGFKNQPFLVYHHEDTGNPHIHIVTTNVKSNGRYISMHNIAWNKSEPARKGIEMEYGLITAESRNKRQQHDLANNDDEVTVFRYDKVETKRHISNVVCTVIEKYKFSSFEDFNAILRQGGVMATKTSNKTKDGKDGLVYSIVDKQGQKIGIPIQASAIYTSPTLSILSKKFKNGFIHKEALKSRFQFEISQLLKRSTSGQDFENRLKQKKIGCTIEFDKNGKVVDIFFVNHGKGKAVYSSTKLGLPAIDLLQELQQRNLVKPDFTPTLLHAGYSLLQEFSNLVTNIVSVFEHLLQHEFTGPDVSAEFFKKKRRRL